VHTRAMHFPFLAAAVGAAALLAAGCSAPGGSATGAKAAPAAAVSPQRALLLAARGVQAVNTIAANVSLRATTSGGDIDIAGSLAERLHPSLLAAADYTTFSTQGQTLPGGIAEVLAQDVLYMKDSQVSQALHTTRPWVEIPLKSLGVTGSALSSLLGTAQEESPVTQTELLAHSKTVHKVGTGVINGVPVTEYAGTYSMSQAIAALPASLRSTISKEIGQAGISSAQFKIWLDGQEQTRKIVVTETGTAISETITETVTSFNQPVSVQAPAAAETYVIPVGALGGLAG
jgi:hypothetical protein